MRKTTIRQLIGACCASVVIAGAVAGCGGEPTGQTVPTAPPEPTGQTGAPAPPATTPIDTPGGTAQRQWTMPDLVGRDLQEAQDQIQKLTGGVVLLTTSHDSTGQNRSQLVDSNWTVCTQNIAAGTPFSKDTTIDFGAVKDSEKCP